MNYRRCKLDASNGVQSLDFGSMWLIKDAFASVLEPVMNERYEGAKQSSSYSWRTSLFKSGCAFKEIYGRRIAGLSFTADAWCRTQLETEVANSSKKFSFASLKQSMFVGKEVSPEFLLMATLPCDTSVTDRMPALAITDAVNELDTLTLFAAAQTGGPAASPVEQRIWILHDWMRRSVPPMPPLPGTPRGPPTWRPAPRSRLCHRAGAGREVADRAPIHLPPEPGDGSIGCPLVGSERTQEDGLVGQLTKGGKACR